MRPEEPPMVSKLTEQTILGMVERPYRAKGAKHPEYVGVNLYIRALNSVLLGEKPGLYWKVQANATGRDGVVQVWEAEGYDLNSAIAAVAAKIPVSLIYPDLPTNKPASKKRVVRKSTTTKPTTKRVIRRKA